MSILLKCDNIIIWQYYPIALPRETRHRAQTPQIHSKIHPKSTPTSKNPLNITSKIQKPYKNEVLEFRAGSWGCLGSVWRGLGDVLGVFLGGSGEVLGSSGEHFGIKNKLNSDVIFWCVVWVVFLRILLDLGSIFKGFWSLKSSLAERRCFYRTCVFESSIFKIRGLRKTSKKRVEIPV